jgi:Tol biopolymer transport system component
VTVVNLPSAQNQSFVLINVTRVKIIGPAGDIDGRGDFRLLVLAADTNGNSGGTFCPGSEAIKIRSGDTIEPCGPFGLSVQENRLGDDLYIVLIGVDEDNGDFFADMGGEIGVNLLSKGLVEGVKRLGELAGATVNPVGVFLLEVALGVTAGQVRDWLEQQDVLGILAVHLSRNQGWQAGRETTLTTNDGGLELSYTVVRTNNPASTAIELAPVEPTPIPGVSRIAVIARRPSGHIVYTCRSGDRYDICVMNADGSGQRRLTNDATGDLMPMLSHTGQFVVFSRYVAGGQHEIFRINVDGTGLTQLTNNGAENVQPSLSPDDSRIAFASNYGSSETFPFQIWVMSSSGYGQQQITFDGSNADAMWSPDGRYISYASTRGGSLQLWVMSPDGSGPSQITPNKDNIGQRHSWLPDGSGLLIYIGKDKEQNRSLYRVSLNGTLRQLTVGTDDYSPEVSPDGQWIAFVSSRGGNDEVYVMRLDGSDLQNLTQDTGAKNYQPRWGP